MIGWCMLGNIREREEPPKNSAAVGLVDSCGVVFTVGKVPVGWYSCKLALHLAPSIEFDFEFLSYITLWFGNEFSYIIVVRF